MLQSLLHAERSAARGRRNAVESVSDLSAGPWPDEARITGHGRMDLGCDSLEALWLSSAACEMFDLAKAGRLGPLVRSDRFGDWLDAIEGAWRDGLGTIVFSTSGTTGRPKRSVHEFADLDAEAGYFAEVFADRRRVLSFVPAHHLYGFMFTALLPDKLGIEVLDIEASTQALAAPQIGDLIVAFPERWMAVSRMVRRWPPGTQGVTSTAPCPPALVEDLISAGLEGVTDVYGSSEVGGIATRRWPSTTYRLLPRWSFAGDDGNALADRLGRQVVLPDTIVHCGADVFTIGSRRDGAVQVGGINVYPDLIAATLSEHPGVDEASVRLMRPDEGSRLKAFVVSDGSIKNEALRAALETWIVQELEVPSRPCALEIGLALPRNTIGKLADW